MIYLDNDLIVVENERVSEKTVEKIVLLEEGFKGKKLRNGLYLDFRNCNFQDLDVKNFYSLLDDEGYFFSDIEYNGVFDFVDCEFTATQESYVRQQDELKELDLSLETCHVVDKKLEVSPEELINLLNKEDADLISFKRDYSNKLKFNISDFDRTYLCSLEESDLQDFISLSLECSKYCENKKIEGVYLVKFNNSNIAFEIKKEGFLSHLYFGSVGINYADNLEFECVGSMTTSEKYDLKSNDLSLEYIRNVNIIDAKEKRSDDLSDFEEIGVFFDELYLKGINLSRSQIALDMEKGVLTLDSCLIDNSELKSDEIYLKNMAFSEANIISNELVTNGVFSLPSKRSDSLGIDRLEIDYMKAVDLEVLSEDYDKEIKAAYVCKSADGQVFLYDIERQEFFSNTIKVSSIDLEDYARQKTLDDIFLKPDQELDKEKEEYLKELIFMEDLEGIVDDFEYKITGNMPCSFQDMKTIFELTDRTKYLKPNTYNLENENIIDTEIFENKNLSGFTDKDLFLLNIKEFRHDGIGGTNEYILEDLYLLELQDKDVGRFDYIDIYSENEIFRNQFDRNSIYIKNESNEIKAMRYSDFDFLEDLGLVREDNRNKELVSEFVDRVGFDQEVKNEIKRRNRPKI